jgi:type IX secretion system PorP/SprF family membrane protein
MYKIIRITLLLVLAQQAVAQQEALYSSYPFMPLVVNPAYAGSREILSGTGVFRSRGLLVPNAPQPSQFFAFDMPIAHGKMGFGVVAFNDPTDIYGKTFGVYPSLAYRIPTSVKGTFSVGLQTGITQATTFGTIGTGGINEIKFNLGMGFYYRADNWYVGLSSPYLTNNGGLFGDARPVYVSAGYVLPVADGTDLRIGALAKKFTGASNSDIKIDGNAAVWFDKRWGIGFWYMNTGSEVDKTSILGSLEIQVSDHFRFGYAFDFAAPTINSNVSGPFSNTTINGIHQIMLRYETDLGTRKLKTVNRMF